MRRPLLFSALGVAVGLAGCPGNTACPSSTTTGTTSGASSSSGTSSSSGALGGPLVGPTDAHCWDTAGAVDGGTTFSAQPTDLSSCDVTDGGPDFNLDAGAPGSLYGPTRYNTQANDDDCKYAVSWRSTPIARNVPVTFWFTTQYATNGLPVTGMVTTPDGGPAIPSCLGSEAPQVYFEVAGDPDGGLANHVNPATVSGVPIAETPAGSGVYRIGPAAFFDEAGLWYIRFHFDAACCDTLPTSPHGHAAFYIDVP